MGWLWSSPPASASSPPSQDTKSLPSPQSTPEPSPSKPLSRDELADQELQTFLSEITSDTTPKPKKYTRIPRSPTSSDPSTSHPSPNEPLSSQLLPTEMSCRVAFDEAFYCNSFGGRFNDLYRYGNLRSCSEHWNNFWFCMKTRSYTGNSKEEAIKEHYRRREGIKYSKEMGKESSEDVWRSRERKVEWGTAFSEAFPPVSEGSDEDWRREELAGRKSGRYGTMG